METALPAVAGTTLRVATASLVLVAPRGKSVLVEAAITARPTSQDAVRAVVRVLVPLAAAATTFQAASATPARRTSHLVAARAVIHTAPLAAAATTFRAATATPVLVAPRGNFIPGETAITARHTTRGAIHAAVSTVVLSVAAATTFRAETATRAAVAAAVTRPMLFSPARWRQTKTDPSLARERPSALCFAAYSSYCNSPSLSVLCVPALPTRTCRVAAWRLQS